MPLYFLHVRNGSDFIEDSEGVECADLAAAEAEAIRGARSIMSADLIDGVLHVDDCIYIVDANGRHCSTIRFEDAITVVRMNGGGAPGQSQADRAPECALPDIPFFLRPE